MPRTFAIGDIHGYTSRLRKLIPLLKARAEPGDTLVTVGDYVDRGPDSRGVLDLIIQLHEGGWDGPVVSLLGNHEQFMLEAVGDPKGRATSLWLTNGGRETIFSYADGTLDKRWASRIPPRHLEFLSELPLWYEDEHAFYVHAGLLEGEHPRDATPETLLWARDEFLPIETPWEKVVVFGHTPQYEPTQQLIIDREKLPWRPLNRPEKIGIDTGAAFGGPLSAVILPEREFISTR